MSSDESVFLLRDRLVADYAEYTRSFIKIADTRIAERVEKELKAGAFWPEPLLQLNPTYLPGGDIDALVGSGALHDECKRVFRIGKTTANPHGKPLILHTHQREAILKAREGRSYVLTSGTGSGKSLTYIIPIVDHVLRSGSGQGVQAIVVYPMNALANSQFEELSKFYEHRERNYAMALVMVESALVESALTGGETPALRRRYERVAARVARVARPGSRSLL